MNLSDIFLSVVMLGSLAFFGGIMYELGRRRSIKNLEEIQSEAFFMGANWLAQDVCICRKCSKNGNDKDKCGMHHLYTALREEIRRQDNIAAGEDWRNL